MAKVSKAQRKANEKWAKKHPAKQRVYQYRSITKRFIREMANHDDLIVLQQMIQDRLNSED